MISFVVKKRKDRKRKNLVTHPFCSSMTLKRADKLIERKERIRVF